MLLHKRSPLTWLASQGQNKNVDAMQCHPPLISNEGWGEDEEEFAAVVQFC